MIDSTYRRFFHLRPAACNLAGGSPLSANELLKQQRVVQELKATTERQAAVIALQEEQVKALTAGLQKVSAQFEASKPASQVVNNNQ